MNVFTIVWYKLFSNYFLFWKHCTTPLLRCAPIVYKGPPKEILIEQQFVPWSWAMLKWKPTPTTHLPSSMKVWNPTMMVQVAQIFRYVSNICLSARNNISMDTNLDNMIAQSWKNITICKWLLTSTMIRTYCSLLILNTGVIFCVQYYNSC